MVRTKKKIALLIILLAPAAAWSNGFYIGLGGGPEGAKFNKNATLNSPTATVNDNSYLAGTGFFASVFGGYSYTHKALYLAGEANLDYSNVKHQSTNNEFINSNFTNTYYRLRRNIGISLVPGYLCTPTTLFYAKLGYALGFFNISSTDSSTASINKNLQGISFGLGINEVINKRYSMRVEYSQIHYQSTSSTTNDVPASTIKTTNIAPTTGKIELALIYKFSD